MAQMKFDSLRSIAFGDISGTYATVGTPLAHNWRAFKISNNTDGDMIVSLDNTDAAGQIFVAANGFTLYDVSTNSEPVKVEDNLLVPIGSQFYIKQSSAPTAGSVYIEGLYAKGE